MRIAIVQRTVCNPVHVPTPNYNVIFEEVSDMTAQQLRYAGCLVRSRIEF
jgi:hypothetical protein